jgi:hypothetical protein
VKLPLSMFPLDILKLTPSLALSTVCTIPPCAPVKKGVALKWQVSLVKKLNSELLLKL